MTTNTYPFIGGPYRNQIIEIDDDQVENGILKLNQPRYAEKKAAIEKKKRGEPLTDDEESMTVVALDETLAIYKMVDGAFSYEGTQVV